MRVWLICLSLSIFFVVGNASQAQQAPNEVDSQSFVFLAGKRPVVVQMHVKIDRKSLEKVWQQAIGHVFRYLDADKNGSLTKKEAAKTPTAQTLFGGGNAYMTQNVSFALLDKDKNGKVSRGELTAFYRRHGGEPFRIGGFGGAIRYLAVGGILSSQNRSSPAVLNRRIFGILDANKNGRLSKNELKRAAVRMHKFDLDDNEMIALDEVEGNRRPADSLNEVFFVDSYAGRKPANPRFIQAHSSLLGKRILSFYGAKSAKHLTYKQVGLTASVCRQLDKNNDAELDATELKQLSKLQPDVEFLVQLGQKDLLQPVVTRFLRKGRALPPDVKIQLESEGMVLRIGNERITFAIGTNQPAWGIVRLANNNEKFYITQFKNADRDNNEYVDAKEVRANFMFRSAFKRMDDDADGKVFQKEFLSYMRTSNKLQSQTNGSFVSMSFSEQGRGLFDLMDSNKDSRLSVRELRSAVRLLAKLDKDHNGLSLAEIPSKFRARIDRGAGRGGYGGAFAVTTSYRMGRRTLLPASGKGPTWFRKMDLNLDGDVSRREFLGPASAFQRLDADRDGLISLTEVMSAEKSNNRNSK